MNSNIGSTTWNDYTLIQNYIYLYHTKEYLILPGYPEQIQDNMAVRYNSTTPLSRTAPIYSYSNSGPRTMNISLNLHRDMMYHLNYSNSSIQLADDINLGLDYVDVLIKRIQSMALPRYDSASMLVDPPIVALRLGNEIYCKGVVTNSVYVTYGLPILESGKYARAQIGFSIAEIDPYDAETVALQGSFRTGLNTTLERDIYTYSNSASGITNSGLF